MASKVITTVKDSETGAIALASSKASMLIPSAIEAAEMRVMNITPRPPGNPQAIGILPEPPGSGPGTQTGQESDEKQTATPSASSAQPVVPEAVATGSSVQPTLSSNAISRQIALAQWTSPPPRSRSRPSRSSSAETNQSIVPCFPLKPRASSATRVLQQAQVAGVTGAEQWTNQQRSGSNTPYEAPQMARTKLRMRPPDDEAMSDNPLIQRYVQSVHEPWMRGEFVPSQRWSQPAQSHTKPPTSNPAQQEALETMFRSMVGKCRPNLLRCSFQPQLSFSVGTVRWCFVVSADSAIVHSTSSLANIVQKLHSEAGCIHILSKKPSASRVVSTRKGTMLF